MPANTKVSQCQICHLDSVNELLDFGLQPICNRFVTDPEQEQFLYPMAMGACTNCGIMQILNPVPAAELMPRFDWITYTEPEDHLDSLVEVITKLPGVTKESKFVGISFKDDSTLSRIERLGFTNIQRLDPKEDLGISEQGVGVESVQDRLTPEKTSIVARRYGKADVIVTRHILEHAHDNRRFTNALKELIKPGGYTVFEVPDCTKSLEQRDYTCPWEEHILYFSPATFQNGLAGCGFSLVRYESYPYPMEDCLVAIVQTDDSCKPTDRTIRKSVSLDAELQRVRTYAASLAEHKRKVQEYLSEFRSTKGKIAMFGAGHLACVYVNLLELDEYIEFIVDDHPKKRGLFAPGSQLPIYESSALVEKNIKLCLLGFHPSSETKVIQNNETFLRNGGTFSSIFSASDLALQI